jgi:hypothetical protein
MLIFLAEMSWAILTLAGVQAIERTAAVWRLIIFAVTDATLLVFWALQKWMIFKQFRGMYFSVHFVVVKAIFDLIASYFIWSHYQRLINRPKPN